ISLCSDSSMRTRRPSSTAVAPALATARAVALPRPPPPPVTSTTRSRSESAAAAGSIAGRIVASKRSGLARVLHELGEFAGLVQVERDVAAADQFAVDEQ